MSKNMDHLVGLAADDLLRHDTRKAKDRLRAILRESPSFKPALELMGRIYYECGDFRNAVMYWGQGDRWDDSARDACSHVLRTACKALLRENSKAARYQLFAFAGTSPPTEIAEQLFHVQSAYFRLDEKRSRFVGLACTPLAGICMLAVIGLAAGSLGGGWGTFLWMGSIALAATLIVLGINICSYIRASKAFRNELAHMVGGR